LISQRPELVTGFQRALLTPNKGEYQRLCSALGLLPDAPVKEVCQKLGGASIFLKAPLDKIHIGATGEELQNETVGSPRRVGGQGDILAGTLACFLAWTKCVNLLNKSKYPSKAPVEELIDPLIRKLTNIPTLIVLSCNIFTSRCYATPASVILPHDRIRSNNDLDYYERVMIACHGASTIMRKVAHETFWQHSQFFIVEDLLKVLPEVMKREIKSQNNTLP
jgi:NAD(P)H-hydrate repair Nnr-like enzyme with NAD(P)H-hydrate dehydratase domain